MLGYALIIGIPVYFLFRTLVYLFRLVDYWHEYKRHYNGTPRATTFDLKRPKLF